MYFFCVRVFSVSVPVVCTRSQVSDQLADCLFAVVGVGVGCLLLPVYMELVPTTTGSSTTLYHTPLPW